RTLGLERQHGATLDRLAIDQHGACTALAGVAADMRTGQAQLLAQQFDEQGTRLDVGDLTLPVDGELDRSHQSLPWRQERTPTEPCTQWGTMPPCTTPASSSSIGTSRRGAAQKLRSATTRANTTTPSWPDGPLAPATR